jgi:hypothetical protein
MLTLINVFEPGMYEIVRTFSPAAGSDLAL